jgi:hypothetical protein
MISAAFWPLFGCRQPSFSEQLLNRTADFGLADALEAAHLFDLVALSRSLSTWCSTWFLVFALCWPARTGSLTSDHGWPAAGPSSSTLNEALGELAAAAADIRKPAA